MSVWSVLLSTGGSEELSVGNRSHCGAVDGHIGPSTDRQAGSSHARVVDNETREEFFAGLALEAQQHRDSAGSPALTEDLEGTSCIVCTTLAVLFSCKESPSHKLSGKEGGAEEEERS